MTDAPHSVHFDDVYFSVHDGLAESTHVFLSGNHLPDRWQGRHFTICETGFGTGRNFLNAWTAFENTTTPQQTLHYYAFEKHPLATSEIAQYLEQWASAFGGRLDKLVKDYPLRVGGWHTLRLSERVTLTLIFDDMNRALPELDSPIDCWFLDGHAPAKNPDIWSEILFTHMARLSATGATVATYTAAALVRKGLEAAGFHVEKIRGFKHKLDMITGVFKAVRPPAETLYIPKKIAVIGGGIAGASVAMDLSLRGVDVHVFEKTHLAAGGSGNMRGLFNPRFAAQKGFESDFFGSAFARAIKMFERLTDVDYAACGSLHLITDDDKQNRFSKIAAHWDWHVDHMRMVDAAEATRIAGIPLKHSALYLPDAGMVSPFKITQALAKCATIHMHDIQEFFQTDTGWNVRGDIFDAVVLTGGKDIARFKETAHLPVQAVRGQISYIATPAVLTHLKANLCYGGYATPNMNGDMVVGSTFQHWLQEDALRDEDHRDVLAKLQTMTPEWNEDVVIQGGRASFRCASKDRVPIIGALAQRGLYLSAAHGSHGLLSSGMGAAMLGSMICRAGQTLPRSVITRLSPHRFSHD